MQRSPQEIKDKLLKALDSDYNVIDMPVVVEIIGQLEHTPITKEVLETTRLGKYINELRRKTKNESVARRAKDLVRKWRHLIVPESVTSGSNGVRSLHNKLPLRSGQLSPGLPARLSQPSSPSSRVSSLSPESKSAFSPGVSPAISPRLPGYSPLPPAAAGRVSTPASPADAASQAPPQKSPPPRQRGRPPKNKNKHKRPLSPGQTTDLVPKTSPANKRLRKNSPQPESVHANGVCVTKLPGAAVSEVPSDPKKRGRSKSSRNSRHEDEDLVKGAMASIVRTPKVKTTRELLQSIQQESSLDTLRSKTLSSLGVAKPDKVDKPVSSSASTEHIHKFLRCSSSSQKEVSLPKAKIEPREEVKPSRTATVTAVPPPRPVTPPSPSGSDVDVEKVSGCEGTPEKPPLPPVKPARLETVEEILAQLPRINPDEILWSDSDDSDKEVEEDVPREVTTRDIERLHSEHLDGVNGNRSDGVAGRGPDDAPHGLQISLDSGFGASAPTCPDDCAFREWHETLSRISYNGELLHILPYVIID